MNAELKDLLTPAAKACGHEVARVADDGDGLLLVGVQDVWRPHLDDGDSRRLAVKLRLRVVCGEFKATCDWWASDGITLLDAQEPVGSDPCAATRLVVLKAAAQIGKGIKT